MDDGGDDDEPVLTALARLAAPSANCVSTSQLASAGFTDQHVASLVRRGALTRVIPRVFVVAAVQVTHEQLLQIALLRGGHHAHLSGRSAAEAHGMLTVRHGTASVAKPRPNRRQTIRLRTAVPIAETGRPGTITIDTVTERRATWELVDGKPAETVARALLRLAATGTRTDLQRAWREADFAKLLTRGAIEQECQRGIPGATRLRALLAEQPPRQVEGQFRSRAEMRLWDAFAARDMTMPRVNTLTDIGGRLLEPDFFFVDEQVIVEADGPQHQLPTRAAEDAVRDAHVRDHGVEVLRFSDDEIDASVGGCALRTDDLLKARRASRPLSAVDKRHKELAALESSL